MASISGTNVAAKVVPFTTDDNYATHESQYGKGGWHEVKTLSERNAIPADRLSNGMACFVTDEETLYIYDAETLTWDPFSAGETATDKQFLVPANWTEDESGQYTIELTDEFFIANGYSYIINPRSDYYGVYASAMVHGVDVTTDTKLRLYSNKILETAIYINVLRMRTTNE